MTSNKQTARQARRDQKQKQQQTRRLIGIVVGMLFVAFLGYFTWQQTTGGNALPAASVPDPMLGNPAATVEIVEYADFGCPACQSWHNSGVREQVLADFGDQVRFVWRDFPVITAQSPQAAEAGQCAGAQDAFWAYHDHIYENFAGLQRAQLIRYATDIGLDPVDFELCLDEGRMRAKVQANEQDARRLGLRGTPGFAVNGRVLPRPPDYPTLAVLIQTELGQ